MNEHPSPSQSPVIWTEEHSLALPTPQSRTCIPITRLDWDRLKRRIGSTCEPSPNISAWVHTSLGVVIPTLLSAGVLFWSSLVSPSGLSGILYPLLIIHLVVGVSALVLCIFCAVVGKGQRTQRAAHIADVLDDMKAIENLYVLESKPQAIPRGEQRRTTRLQTELTGNLQKSSVYCKVLLLWVGNWNLRKDYRDPPVGHVSFNGVPFAIAAGDHGALNSTFMKEDTVLPSPSDNLRVSRAYVLVNAGNALKQFGELGKVVGCMSLVFSDGREHRTQLILGKNIREWAPGTFPGGTVDSVTDQRSVQVWEGQNTGSKRAVIDMLEISVPDGLREKSLSRIVISKSDEPRLRAVFMILGITLQSASVPPS